MTDEEQVGDRFLHGFTASFTMILVSEIADKTFFIAAIMSSQYNRLVVYIGSFGALIVMTVLSVVVGAVMLSMIPPNITDLIANLLFLAFGLHSLKEGLQMKKNDTTEFQETQIELKQLNENKMNDPEADTASITSNQSIVKQVFNRVLLQAFTLTFLAEWGDRSQIATFALAAQKNPYGVCVGGIAGHAICTGIAVIGGSLLSRKIDPKSITIIGGIVFCGFAIVGLSKMAMDDKFGDLLNWKPDEEEDLAAD